RSLDFFFAAQGERLLFLVMVENAAQIGTAPVAELPTAIQRVHIAPENLEQFAIGNFLIVEGDLHHLLMTGIAGGNFVVAGILDMATCVAGNCGDHTGKLIEWLLHTPEATTGEGRFLYVGPGRKAREEN